VSLAVTIERNPSWAIADASPRPPSGVAGRLDRANVGAHSRRQRAV